MQFSEQRQFEIRVQPHGRTALVKLVGEFDLASKKRFEASLSEVASAGPEEVILDLRDVVFIDSTGLRLLLELSNQSRRVGFEFAVLRSDGQVRRILQETGLDQVLPLIEGVPGSEFKGSGSGSGNGTLAWKQ